MQAKPGVISFLQSRSALRPLLVAFAGTSIGLLAALGHVRDSDAADETAVIAAPLLSGDWPQWGGSSSRNNAPDAKNIASDWDVGDYDRKTDRFVPGSSRNIRWVAALGSQSYGTPVVADGRVYIGTNNGRGYLARYPSSVDLGCLLCFREADGRFLWQYSTTKHPLGRAVDWPLQGICSTPLVEGDRLWFVTNLCEVVCLDTEGFADGENDGPYAQEKATGQDEADTVWSLNMMTELGVWPHNMATCSVTAAGDLLFVITSNGVNEGHVDIPNPAAPSFLCLDKRSGRVLWQDNSPGMNILHAQWSSPAYGVLDGVPQAIFGGGDGWLYSFRAVATSDGKAELLWKFDCNPKEGVFSLDGRSSRHIICGMPVIYDGLVYITVGDDPENCGGPGHLWCIDPTKRGDVSPQLVFNEKAPNEPIPPKRYLAVVPEDGDFVKDNPNSALVWHFAAADVVDFNDDGQIDRKDEFLATMHLAVGTAAIKDGLLLIPDHSGLLHCIDAKTGRRHWVFDLLASCWSSPLIADGKVFIGDEDSDMSIFPLTADPALAIKKNAKGKPVPGINMLSMGQAVYSTPIVANGILYIASKDHLFAIQADEIAPVD